MTAGEATGTMSQQATSRIHVCHIIYRLEYGGLQNGLVNLVNRLPADDFRHTIVCLVDSTEYRRRITAENVEIIEIGKHPGKDVAAYGRVFRALRRLRPDIVHTRNYAAVDTIFIAKLAGVPAVVHSEHGLDVLEMTGGRRYIYLRRLARPFVDHFVAMSRDLADWLARVVHVDEGRLGIVYNGVDTKAFSPGPKPGDLAPTGFLPEDAFVIGTVGRLEPVKDPVTLAAAFVSLLTTRPELKARVRLAIIGDGTLKDDVEAVLATAGVRDLAWLPGYTDNTAAMYRLFDLFVLPSRREGISNTLLEAQSTGVAVVATRVGGNPEIVAEGAGVLIPPEDPEGMAAAIGRFIDDRGLAATCGRRARAEMERRFSLDRMVADYDSLYRRLTA